MSRIKSYLNPKADRAINPTIEHYAPQRNGRPGQGQSRCGEYATESEVIRDGLRTLMARDQAMETWLREQVVPAAQALKADPGRAVSVDLAREQLAEKRRRRA